MTKPRFYTSPSVVWAGMMWGTGMAFLLLGLDPFVGWATVVMLVITIIWIIWSARRGEWP